MPGVISGQRGLRVQMRRFNLICQYFNAGCSKEDLRRKINREMGHDYSISTYEKDLWVLRNELDLDIIYYKSEKVYRCKEPINFTEKLMEWTNGVSHGEADFASDETHDRQIENFYQTLREEDKHKIEAELDCLQNEKQEVVDDLISMPSTQVEWDLLSEQNRNLSIDILTAERKTENILRGIPLLGEATPTPVEH